MQGLLFPRWCRYLGSVGSCSLRGLLARTHWPLSGSKVATVTLSLPVFCRLEKRVLMWRRKGCLAAPSFEEGEIEEKTRETRRVHTLEFS